jgi:hypothetical protein
MQFTTMIVEGEFALVEAGNCTQTWMIDGPDLEDRARTLWGQWDASYYGPWSPSHIRKRGVRGVAVMREGSPYADLYVSREFAEAAVAKATGGQP